MTSRRLAVLATFALLAGSSVRAEDSKALGLQVRWSAPLDSVGEATGRKGRPGLGLHVEMDIEDGWRWRVGVGGDQWGYGPWDNRPGVEGQVATLYVEAEGMKFLRADTEATRRGPYVLAGVRAIHWAIQDRSAVLDLKTTRNTIHLGASLGLGYRIAPWCDVEHKAWYGHADPTFRGGAATAGLTFRF